MVFQEFISPLQAEIIVDHLNVTVPDTDTEDTPVLMRIPHKTAEALVFERLEHIIPRIESYYNVQYKGTEQPIVFEWYAEGASGYPRCENSHYVKGKWVRTKHRDLSCVLFLSEYRDNLPFDEDYEVYGGKLEFPQHKFGFNPQRGTLIVHPSDPHFINVTTQSNVGELFQVRINITTKDPLIYSPEGYPGDFTVWLQEYA